MESDAEYAAYVSGRWAALVRSLVLLGHSRAEAEDLVQSALVRCYVAWDKVSRADDRDAYVYRVLLNERATSRRRRWWRERPTAVLPEQVVDDGTDLAELSATVQRALAELSDAHRRVIVLRYYADLTEAQTAEALGVPCGTVKSRLSRAIAHLAADPTLADVPGWSTL